jgi:hypothetical protein
MQMLFTVFKEQVELSCSREHRYSLTLDASGTMFEPFINSLPDRYLIDWMMKAEEFCSNHKLLGGLQRRFGEVLVLLNATGKMDALEKIWREQRELIYFGVDETDNYEENWYVKREELQHLEEELLTPDIAPLVAEYDELYAHIMNLYYPFTENAVMRLAFNAWWLSLSPKLREIYHASCIEVSHEVLLDNLCLPRFKKFLLENLPQIFQTNLELLFLKVPIPLPIHQRPQLKPNSPNIAA